LTVSRSINSPDSLRRYGELLASVSQRASAVPAGDKPHKAAHTTVGALCLKFATEELPRYSDAEQRCQKVAIRILRELFGETPAADFGPLRLRTVRQAMVDKGWSRWFTNKEVKRLRHIFIWGVSWEVVPQTVADSLKSVGSLVAGESDAPDTRPRHAVPDEQLRAVRDVLCQRHRDVFDLLLLTGARPGELIGLTTGDIDRAGEK